MSKITQLIKAISSIWVPTCRQDSAFSAPPRSLLWLPSGRQLPGALAGTLLKKQREGGGRTETNVGSFRPLKPITFLPLGLWPLCQIIKGQESASFLVLNNMTILPGNGGVKMHEFYNVLHSTEGFCRNSGTSFVLLWNGCLRGNGTWFAETGPHFHWWLSSFSATAGLSPRLPRVAPLWSPLPAAFAGLASSLGCIKGTSDT